MREYSDIRTAQYHALTAADETRQNQLIVRQGTRYIVRPADEPQYMEQVVELVEPLPTAEERDRELREFWANRR